MPASPKYEREMATVKADIAAIGHLFSKLDTTLEKLEESTSNISALLAVHEERLNNQEDALAVRRREVDVDIKELHSRISTAGRENNDQHRQLAKDMKQSEEKSLEAINDLRKDISKEQQNLEERLGALEKWRWIIIGAIAAATVLIPNLGDLLSFM